MDSVEPRAEQKKRKNTLSAAFDVGLHVKEDLYRAPHKNAYAL